MTTAITIVIAVIVSVPVTILTETIVHTFTRPRYRRENR